MPENRATVFFSIIPGQILPAEKRSLLRFSLLSALAHAALLALLITWSGAGSGVQPPLRVITVDLGRVESSRPPVEPGTARPRRQEALSRLSPPSPIRAQPAPAAIQQPIVAKPEPAAPSSGQTTATATASPGFPRGAQPGPLPGRVSGGGDGAGAAVSASAAPGAAPGVAVPASGPVSGRAADKSGIRAGFMQRCRALIERRKEYPLMARKGMVEGTVLVRGTLGRDGVLRHCLLVRSSGSGLLDNAALRAVRSVERFPPLPPELAGSELAFELPVTFRLSAE